jgi:hypothetical protein
MTDQHPKRPSDPNQLAKSIIDSVTGQQPSPVDNRPAVASAASMTPERRAEIAKKATKE